MIDREAEVAPKSLGRIEACDGLLKEIAVNEKIDTVIIGAGHAGLTMSYFLSERGLEHVIVERGRVGERWISERWDSFYFQFPNWTIELPGYKYQTEDPDGFVPGREIVRFIQEYADFIKAPVRSGVDVTALETSSNAMPYLLRTNAGAIEASNVVIATGQREKGVIPPFSSDVPHDVHQLHSSAYRNAGELPPGAVLVVGERRVGLSDRRGFAPKWPTGLRLHGAPSSPSATLSRARLRLVGDEIGRIRPSARRDIGDLSAVRVVDRRQWRLRGRLAGVGFKRNRFAGSV
ncbi:MAG TPA: NAD(P)-binding domain-containing protein, partial [Candidatus Binatia bacterium]|nr:NAD(P)-binding domain-containing protein [Candidatus Binatia bacterium]